MNDIILNILERRSIRQYEDKAVSKETMAEILNAGAWAPSAMNRQTGGSPELLIRKRCRSWRPP